LHIVEFEPFFSLNRQSQQLLAELRIILFIKPVESSQYLVQFPPHWLPFCYLKLFICKVMPNGAKSLWILGFRVSSLGCQILVSVLTAKKHWLLYAWNLSGHESVQHDSFV
jgi:hypothetical protein